MTSKRLLTRSQFLKSLSGAALVAASCSPARAQASDRETVIYQTAQGCEIQADIYPVASGEGNAAAKPALLWMHGGGLMGGSRKQVGTPMLKGLHESGFVIVSIDYRLAPSTKLPQIVEDVQDAWRWMRKDGAARFGIDPDRIAVAGASAGGYLALMGGFCLDPCPRTVVSYSGYGDIDGAWLSLPSELYRKQPLVSKEAAETGAGTAIIAEPPAGNRGDIYLMSRQQGLWPYEVTGHDPMNEAKWFDAYCPNRNVTKTYPPTMLVHGTTDTDVPFEESSNMDAKLEEAGVAHDLVSVSGAGYDLAGAKPEDRRDYTVRSMEWVMTHTR